MRGGFLQSGGGDECPSLGHLAGHGREREKGINGGGWWKLVSKNTHLDRFNRSSTSSKRSRSTIRSTAISPTKKTTIQSKRRSWGWRWRPWCCGVGGCGDGDEEEFGGG